MFFSAGIGNFARARVAALILITPPPPRLLGRAAMLRRGFLLLGVMGLVVAACAGPMATATPQPTYTPYPTATPFPTPTPQPTYTPYPTATPFPTPTPQPTYTPYPTPTPVPTPTPAPRPTATLGVLVNAAEAAPGYTLFNTHSGDAYYLIDRQGRVAQQWPAPGGANLAKLLENGNLLTGGYGNRMRNGIREIDLEGKVVWQYRFPSWTHDFLLLPNGNALLLGEQLKSNGEVIALGGDPKYIGNQGWRGTHLVEVRPTPPEGGEVVWEWSAWDHIIQDFDPEKPNYGVVADHPELIDLNYPQNRTGLPYGDWQHTNSLAYHPELEQIMVSVRHFSEIWIIDRSTTTEEAAGHSGGNSGKGGDLLYRWGNPRAWQMGTVADQQLWGLHNAHWIEPGLPGAGNVLVFNNGWEFGEFRRGYSSVDELTLPAAGYNYQREPGKPYGPERPEWTFHDVAPADFYSGNMGCAQRLPNGNTLFCYSRLGIIWEVTPAGKTVWKYLNPALLPGGPARQGELIGRHVNNPVYRAYHYPPDYPGLDKLDLTPGEPIELPALP